MDGARCGMPTSGSLSLVYQALCTSKKVRMLNAWSHVPFTLYHRLNDIDSTRDVLNSLWIHAQTKDLRRQPCWKLVFFWKQNLCLLTCQHSRESIFRQSKVCATVVIHSKCMRALIFENFCQAGGPFLTGRAKVSFSDCVWLSNNY